MKLLVGLMLMAFATGIFAGDHAYVGAAKCAKMCHKSPKQGEQFPIWEKSKHAQAYKTLATPAALEIGKKKGIAEPQKSEKCLKCHVTGYSEDAKLKEPTYSAEEGITCEACHGAGKDYAKMNIMKDKKASLAAGMVEPSEKVCVQCHNAESPTFSAFKYDEMVKKIAHPVPAGK